MKGNVATDLTDVVTETAFFTAGDKVVAAIDRYDL